MNAKQITAAANSVAEALEGTADSLESAVWKVLEIEDPWNTLPRAFFDELDQHVMCCESCNWWCSSDEIDDDQICQNCQS